MSYVIDVAYMEIQAMAKIRIFHASENFTSARKSQFQCIGWILDIVNQVKSKVEDCYITNPDYAIVALTDIAKLSHAQAVSLLEKTNLKDQFQYTWSILDEWERDFALHMDFNHFHNFWPGFDIYNPAWSQSITNIISAHPSSPDAHQNDSTHSINIS